MIDRIDWNRLWKESGHAEEKNGAREFWDSYAPHFRKKGVHGEKDPYVEQFFNLAGLKPGETVFDMGCGSGTLAIPYAQRGLEIYAADFSPEMLRVLMQDAEEEGVADKIHPIQLDWNEDWSKRDLPKCDVAISSRSLIVRDLTQALKNLESVAKDRVCVGAWDVPSMGFNRVVAKAIGYERPGYGVYWFVMNELMDRDRFPELSFIRSPFRNDKYESYEAGVEKLKASFQYGLTDEQQKLLEEFCEEHLKFHEGDEDRRTSARGDAQGKPEYWQMDTSDMSTMAFIKWFV